MDKIPIYIISFIIILAIAFFVFNSGFIGKMNQNIPIPEGIILFYGDGCPHCKNVDEFISQNKIEDKIKFSKLEVYYNKNNQNILSQVAEKCNLDKNNIGVPMLYNGNGKCYEGDIDAINFFKNETGIQ